MDKHDLIVAVKKLASELDRRPTFIEFANHVRGGKHSTQKLFGQFSNLLEAAGIENTHRAIGPVMLKEEQRAINKLISIVSKKEPLQGHFRHIIDLDSLFKRAGNPEVLKMSVQPDTHGKNRDEPAFNSYLKFLKYYKPDMHLILGDFVDCDGASPWPAKNLEPKRLVPEMKIGREMLKRLVDATPSCSTRIFLEGNHENWIIQALTKVPELFQDLEDLGIQVNLKSMLALEKYGYELFPVNHFIQIAKAHFTHGLYTCANHAKKHLDVLKVNIYYGHLHDVQEHNQTSMDGGMESVSCGCLCKLDAEFLKGKPNNWVHSHTTFEFQRDGTYHRLKHLIYNGKTTFNGMIFDGNI